MSLCGDLVQSARGTVSYRRLARFIPRLPLPGISAVVDTRQYKPLLIDLDSLAHPLFTFGHFNPGLWGVPPATTMQGPFVLHARVRNKEN